MDCAIEFGGKSLCRKESARLNVERNSRSKVVISTFYQFAALPDFRSLREPLLKVLLRHDVRGTVLLAAEGVNGTIAGPRAGIDAVLKEIRADSRLRELRARESFSAENPFYRTRVKLKKEIVAMGAPEIDPRCMAGAYVPPEQWNELIDDPEVLVLDTRNRYEVEIGSFENAVNPETDSFREFPEYVRENLDPAKHRKVAMFCTGGIRCEKSTAYLKQRGFAEVYHLQGGILNYLESVPPEDSRWRGECFVFDNRVTVNHRLEPGAYDQCHACRMPISDEDKQSPLYERGVSCPHCHECRTGERAKRFAERQRQVDLARARGEQHIGQDMDRIKRERGQAKLRRKQDQRRKSRRRRQTAVKPAGAWGAESASPKAGNSKRGSSSTRG